MQIDGERIRRIKYRIAIDENERRRKNYGK